MQKEKQKVKPTHSSFSNVLWAVGQLKKYTPSTFVIMVLLIPLEIGVQYLGIYLPALVVSGVTAGEHLLQVLLGVGGTMFLLLLGNFLIQTLSIIQGAQQGIYRYEVTNTVTRKTLDLFYQDFEKKEVRSLEARATRATEMWDGSQPIQDIVRNGFGILRNILGYLIFGTVISFASPWLLPLLTVAPIVNLWAVRVYDRWEYARRGSRTDLERRLNYVQSLPGRLSAGKDIRIYSMSQWLREIYQELFTENDRLNRKLVKYNFLSHAADLLVILLRDGGAYALLISMYLRGEITVDRFVLYFAAISSFASWVGGVIDCWNRIHSDSLLICDLRDFIDYPQQDGSGEARSEDFRKEAPEIVFDKVSFRYEGASEDTLHELSFTIHKGEKVALVGMNGAGKTTIVKLLCGLYRPDSGTITINGVPQSAFYRKDYYRLISPVFQDVRMGFFSLGEILSGKRLEDTDQERAKRCLADAGLLEKVNALPEGLATKLGKKANKNGTEFSGGEAQKLMLARALYKDAPILVLDEPTAALDPIAESQIYQEYNQMAQNKTSLFISHRLASTSFCDRILLIQDGKIAEEGSHKELIRLGGTYQMLFETQSCWYQEDGKGSDGVSASGIGVNWEDADTGAAGSGGAGKEAV